MILTLRLSRRRGHFVTRRSSASRRANWGFKFPTLARNGSSGPPSLTAAFRRQADLPNFNIRATPHNGLSSGEPLTSGFDSKENLLNAQSLLFGLLGWSQISFLTLQLLLTRQFRNWKPVLWVEFCLFTGFEGVGKCVIIQIKQK